ncbi:6399_t:CDS:2, partial [Gigaspora margarita]
DAYQDCNSVYVKLQVPEVTNNINELKEKEITHLINLGKQVANSNNYDQSFKKRATQLKNETWKSIQQIIYGLGQKLRNTDSELQNTCKKLYRLQKKVLTLQELLEKESDSSRYTIIKIYIITRQNKKSQYFQKQEKFFNGIKTITEESANNALHAACEEVMQKKDILESKVREAPQASAEFVYKGTPEACKLIEIISKVTPTLYEYNITLDIGVDSNLNTNKTLSDPNLIGYTESQANALKEFLKKHTKLLPKQILHNNNGLLEMLEIVIQVGNLLKFSKEDEINIRRI